MAVEVLITRHFKGDKMREAYKIVAQLRSAAVLSYGLYSSQTLISEDTPNKVVVACTWFNRDAWEGWRTNRKRQELLGKLQECLASPEEVEVFQIGEKDPEWVHMA